MTGAPSSRSRPRRRRPVIALVGVDGVGKTTQARRLATALTAAGHPARYFENGGGRPVVDALAHRLGRRDGPDLLGRRAHVALETTIRGLALAWALAVSARTGQIAVMDRYTYCQYATMRLRGDSGEGRVRAAYRLAPTPDLVVWLTLAPTEAARRVELRGRDHEDPARLAAFAAAYASLPEAPTFHHLPATADADALHARLLALAADRLLDLDGYVMLTDATASGGSRWESGAVPPLSPGHATLRGRRPRPPCRPHGQG
jgi:dTMP kinase